MSRMKYDIGVFRTVVSPDITEDIHTKHEFTEAGVNFTVFKHQIPATAENDPRLKHLVPFNPEDFDTDGLIEKEESTQSL